MSTAVARIDEFLNRKRLVKETLDPSIVTMVVDALPAISFGDDFRARMFAILEGKVNAQTIEEIVQVLVTELPAMAEKILKMRSENLGS